MFWDNTNVRIGIGTTSPGFSADILVSGNGFRGYNIKNSSTGTSALSGFLAANDGSALANFGLSGGSYNVITVIGSNAGFINSTGAGGIALYANNTSGTIRFATNILGAATEVARFTNSGNFGIGQPSPSHKLDLLGSQNSAFGYNVQNTSSGASALAGYLSTSNSGVLVNFGVSSSGYTTNTTTVS